MSASLRTVVSGSRRVLLPGARALSRANPNASVEVLLKVRRKKDVGALDTRPQAAMAREDVGKQYGADDKDIALVSDTFKALGLTVDATNAATRSVELSGSVSDMENAFSVKLFNYAHADGNYRGRVGDVFVPTAVKDVVVGVFGLDNRRVARRRRTVPTNSGAAKGTFSIPASWYTPAELATRYNFPPGDGTGQTVGLLEFGGGYFPNDLNNFCTLAKISTPTVVPISVDGTSTSAEDGAEGEVMLDIEVVAGVCPKATIAVYFAQWGERGWLKALDAAIHGTKQKPSVLSVSWGSPEDTDIWTNQAMVQVNETLKDGALAGVTVCISAGDDGSSDADGDGLAHADFPASSPYVLAVGGTTIPKKGAPLPDLVWFEGNGLRQQNNPNSGSSGGGVSTIFPRPAWQQGIDITSVNPHAIVGRCLPDLAANADWTASPYLLCVDNGAQGNGGTSAASPLVAGLIARINGGPGASSPVGYLTPLLYQAGPNGHPLGLSVCDDVVSGQNATAHVGGYSAQIGYDAVSGWGTPNGAKLSAALAALDAKQGKAAPPAG
jgi:kumamolisin